MGRVFPQLGGDRRKSIDFRRLKSISDGPDLIIAGLCDRGPTEQRDGERDRRAVFEEENTTR
jgi:hypothetical protein